MDSQFFLFYSQAVIILYKCLRWAPGHTAFSWGAWEPLPLQCLACFCSLAFCQFNSKCLGPSEKWRYSFSVRLIHDVTSHLYILFSKIAFIWKIILIRNAWLTLIIMIIFWSSIPPKVQKSEETERRNTEVKIHCKKTYLKQKKWWKKTEC